MPINYQKIVDLRSRIIQESKDSVPRMEMFQMYMLAEMKVQTIIMAYSEANKRFVEKTGKEIDDLITEVDQSIKKEHGKST